MAEWSEWEQLWRGGMAEVRVRKLDEAVVHNLKERAKREGTSVEALLRRFITEATERPRLELLTQLREHQRVMRETCGVLPDSTPGIREWRDGLE